MGLDTKTYWLFDRQSQCNFDFDFESVIISVLKSVAKKRLVKTEDFYVCCGYSDNWRLWFRESAIITVLKSVTRKRLVKTEDFYVSCGYSDIWSVGFSVTILLVVVAIRKWSIDPVSNPKPRR
jgi:hypothetical protein